MKFLFEKEDRVLAVMAHPDDAELLCAGTLARAREDGAAIAICIMCRGDKGIGSATSAENLAAVRRAEAQPAAAMIGAELAWLDHPDGELLDTPAARMQLIGTFRRFRPTLVITHAPEDYHPDHQAASAVAEAATWLAASRGQVTLGLEALTRPPALWWADTVQMCGFEPAFYIDISAQAQTKRRMLQCHQSQEQRGSDAEFASLLGLMSEQMGVRGSQAGVTAAEAFRTHPAFKRLRAW